MTEPLPIPGEYGEAEENPLGVSIFFSDRLMDFETKYIGVIV